MSLSLPFEGKQISTILIFKLRYSSDLVFVLGTIFSVQNLAEVVLYWFSFRVNYDNIQSSLLWSVFVSPA